MNNTLNLAIRKAARNLGVDQKLVESVYKSYWLFIKEHITSLPLRDMDLEELGVIVSNVSLPFIGKLYVDSNKIKNRRNLIYLQNAKIEESKANRLSGSGN